MIDNAADEALAGHGQRIDLTLHADGSVSVGRWPRHPFGLHPEEQVPVVEIVFTRLHAGGKFDKGAGGAYSFSGRPARRGRERDQRAGQAPAGHGYREGQVANIAFSGGDVVEPLEDVRRPRPATARAAPRCACGRMRSISTAPSCRAASWMHLLRSKAVLMPGVTSRDPRRKSREGRETPAVALQGRPARLPDADAGGRPSSRCSRASSTPAGAETENFAEGEGAAWCVAFTDDGNVMRESYVNLIPTPPAARTSRA